MQKTDEQHIIRLRRLRVLQSLQRAAPEPMGEAAILYAVRTDPELSPTIERVRKSLIYLHSEGLVDLITVDCDAQGCANVAEGRTPKVTDWMAGRVTDLGLDFLESSEPITNLDIYHTTTLPEPAFKTQAGRVSTIVLLPPEAKAWLDQELVNRNFTGYIEMAELLATQGYEISKSALGRYGKKFKEEQKQLKQSIEMAKAFAEVVGDDGAAMNQTLTALAQQELMTVIRSGKYDDNIKLPALVRSVATLNRSDINTRKFQIEQAARQKALNDAADAVETAAHEQGMNEEQAQFWREKVLGVK